MDSHKKELKEAWREQEQQKLAASVPMPYQDLRDLFDFLDRKEISHCDHTLRETTKFLCRRNLDVKRIVQWLHEYGGFCDCEVISNVEEKFVEIIGRN